MIDYEGTHLNSAMALYRQRDGWLCKDRVDMQSMLDLEYRLRVHLHVLSRCISENDPEPGAAADTFIYLAARLSSSDTEVVTKAGILACDWLLEQGPKSAGARDALLLFPSPNLYAHMQKIFTKMEALRPVLIYILAQHGARLPRSLTHRADLQDKDPFLQAQTLYYAANDQGSDLNMFREYYEPMTRDPEPSRHDHGTLVAAIWGGLLRADATARVALQRAIEHESDDIARLDFLRLAALLGEDDYFPLFCHVAEHAPEVGYHFLALHGSTQSVQTILDGLSHPRTAEYAETAWWWVSAQVLPKKPRLSVVGEENQNVDNEVGFIPDAQPAQHWWQKQTQDQATRWLQGQTFGIPVLQQMLRQYTGAISNDLFDLMALNAQVPVQFGNSIWHETRLRKIGSIEKKTGSTIREVNPEVRSA